MKRHSIVYYNGDGGFFRVYGRVHLFKGDYALVVDTGKYYRWLPIKDLVVLNDYKGYVDHKGHFVKMPTLRNMLRYRVGYGQERISVQNPEVVENIV